MQEDQNFPNLILMDIMLDGEMKGTEAAKLIQEKFDVPIVFLTAYSDTENLTEAKKSNPAGYIIKPVVSETDIGPTIEIAIYNHKTQKNKQVLANQKLKEIKKLIGKNQISPNASSGSKKDSQALDKHNDMISQDSKSSAFLERNAFFSLIQTQKNLSEISNFFSVLASVERMKILLNLKDGGLFFKEIMSIIGKKKATTSHHLQKLFEVNLIVSQQKHNLTKYMLRNDEKLDLALERCSKAEKIEECINLFQTLTNEERLKILRSLSKSPKKTSELFNNFDDKAKSTISHHMKVLKDNGWVLAEKKGRSYLYSISTTHLGIINQMAELFLKKNPK